MALTITLESSKTIQKVATLYTGNIANAPRLMTLNKLTSQNLVKGQKVTIPETMLTSVYKPKLIDLRQAGPVTKNKMLLMGVAAIAGLWYMKTKGILKFS